MREIALRMDDVGAASKINNQHGKTHWRIWGNNLPLTPFANWLFLKRIRPFKKAGPYNELTYKDWIEIFRLLERYDAKLTVGITATWVETKDKLISFPKKFPEEAAKLKEGVQEGIIEVGNHGLTHCVLDNNSFKPKLFSSNRNFHREFWEWVPKEIHREHIFRAQDILTSFFKIDILTFIPPGNVWTNDTEIFAKEAGIKYLSSLEDKAPTGKISNGLIYVGNNNVLDFHDREIAIYGTEWLEEKLQTIKLRNVFVKDLVVPNENI